MTEETPKRSFADQIIAKKGHLVHKLKAKDSTGQWAYYFVLVEPTKEQAFLASLKTEETIDLEDYGKVIASCYGEEPNDQLKKDLKDRYGFEV